MSDRESHPRLPTMMASALFMCEARGWCKVVASSEMLDCATSKVETVLSDNNCLVLFVSDYNLTTLLSFALLLGSGTSAPSEIIS
jgi:hypothetical protein